MPSVLRFMSSTVARWGWGPRSWAPHWLEEQDPRVHCHSYPVINGHKCPCGWEARVWSTSLNPTRFPGAAGSAITDRCLGCRLPPSFPQFHLLYISHLPTFRCTDACNNPSSWYAGAHLPNCVCFTGCRLTGKTKAALHSTMLLTSLSALSVY